MHTNQSMWSGLSLLVGGLLASLAWIGFAILDPSHIRYTAGTWWPLNGLAIAGGVLMALGLPGLYARQAEQSGILGLIGIVILFVGIVIGYVAVQSIETATSPNIPPGMIRLASIGAPSAFFGALITGFTIWTAGVYPRWLAVALVVSVLLGLLTRLVPLPDWLGRSLMSAAFTGTLAALGIALMRLARVPVE